MYADIEQLVLSGELFNPRPASPTRAPSPDGALWGGADEQPADDEEARAAHARNAQIEQMLGQPLPPDADAVGMGDGRTGVKGVIKDRDEAEGRKRERERRDRREVKERMERMALSARTYAEDEKAERREKGEHGEEGEEGRTDMWGARKGRFGHLREVGVRGFVGALEEERGVWVVIHLYEPSLERCFALDDTLAQLARRHADVKFLRARAGALGFAKPSAPAPSSHPTKRINRPARRVPGGLSDDSEDADDKSEDEVDEDEVDGDMLPTMLVYRDGELVHNWVRVDWEAGAAGVPDLLERHHILEPVGAFGPSNPLDDEGLWASEED